MKKNISIIGGGPAALMLASKLDPQKFNVTIYEKNKTLGRKFLVAGKGGFNLTHSEPSQDMILRYTPNTFLKGAINHFDNLQLREWLKTIGIPTFIGSSKRIYPKEGIKPIEVLNAILNELEELGVNIQYNTEWKTWEDDMIVNADIVVFALGGGSWKVTGSEGDWLSRFNTKGVETHPFEPSNCAFKVNWEKDFTQQNGGAPLKNISIACCGVKHKGEVVVIKFGLEGNAIYALSPQIRESMHNDGFATIHMDLKPSLSEAVLLEKMKSSSFRNKSEILRKTLRLSPTQIALVKQFATKEEFLDSILVVQRIKALPIKIVDTANLDEAISTVGGIALDALDGKYQLKKIKNTYCIGEMLDWDAPTGGYLLQACFSMGADLAKHLNDSI